MPLTDVEQRVLIDLLVARGWHWREDTFYAPNRSMWFGAGGPQWSDLDDFYERMTARRDRIIGHKTYYSSEAQHAQIVSDTAGLVECLGDMIRKRNGVTE